MVWEPSQVSESEQQRLEMRAATDARQLAERIWRDGLPGGTSLQPVAVRATYAFIAALRQESSAIPRWAWVSQEAMQQFIQITGDRYYYAFLKSLAYAIADGVQTFYAIPRLFAPVETGAAEEETPETPPTPVPTRRTRKHS